MHHYEYHIYDDATHYHNRRIGKATAVYLKSSPDLANRKSVIGHLFMGIICGKAALSHLIVMRIQRTGKRNSFRFFFLKIIKSGFTEDVPHFVSPI